MPIESNLLKEAIADAKAVRQTALANAKVALEEAFSERYHAMFAEKLKEDAAMDEAPSATPSPAEEPVSEQEIDELIKELEAEVGDEKPDMDGAPSMDSTPDAAPDTEVPPMDAAPAAPVDGAPLSAGQTVKLVPVAEPSAPAPEMPEAPEAGAPAPVTPPSEAPVGGEEEMDEEINLDELLQSLKEEIEDEEKKEEEEECMNEQTKLASSGIGGKTGGSDNKKPSSSASASSKVETGGCKNNGLPESTQEAKDATEASRPNQGKNATSTNLSTPSKGGEAGPALKAARPNSKGDFENTPKLHEENVSLKKQLDEATEVIKYVKGQLNEVNLLNAKLLYTNKLFKEFAMNNDQKMRIVEMFDLAKTVREIKLTYANIAESLNFGATEPKKKASAQTSVQSITEGLASKPVGSTKPSAQIISENKVSSQVSRFQKLAGIKGA